MCLYLIRGIPDAHFLLTCSVLVYFQPHRNWQWNKINWDILKWYLWINKLCFLYGKDNLQHCLKYAAEHCANLDLNLLSYFHPLLFFSAIPGQGVPHFQSFQKKLPTKSQEIRFLPKSSLKLQLPYSTRSEPLDTTGKCMELTADFQEHFPDLTSVAYYCSFSR